MSTKPSVPLRIAPLQRVRAVPITDTAEQAALDKFREREKRKQSGDKAKVNRNGATVALNPAAKRKR